jgi:hypothetical protein
VGIKRALTTSYHPQADGQTEIMNQTLETALRCYVSKDRNDWDDYLQPFCLSYNSTPHSSTGYSPAELLFGFKPLTASRLLTDLGESHGSESLIAAGTDRTEALDLVADQWINQLEAHRSHAKDCLVFAQAQQQRQYNKGRLIREFEVGDLVLLNTHTLRLLGQEKGRGQKLLPKFDGPFEIQDKLSPITYRIRLSSNYGIHPVINIAHLEPYNERTLAEDDKGTKAPRLAKRDEKHEAYMEKEIEAIIAERRKKRGKKSIIQYKIRYKDTGPEEDEWHPIGHINAPELLRAWKSKKKK